jgi:hypothetical protein
MVLSFTATQMQQAIRELDDEPSIALHEHGFSHAERFVRAGQFFGPSDDRDDSAVARRGRAFAGFGSLNLPFHDPLNLLRTSVSSLLAPCSCFSGSFQPHILMMISAIHG